MIQPQIPSKQNKPDSSKLNQIQPHTHPIRNLPICQPTHQPVQPNSHHKHNNIINSLHNQKQIKLTMIIISYTIPYPETMMIVALNASLAFLAVSASVWEDKFTIFACEFGGFCWGFLLFCFLLGMCLLGGFVFLQVYFVFMLLCLWGFLPNYISLFLIHHTLNHTYFTSLLPLPDQPNINTITQPIIPICNPVATNEKTIIHNDSYYRWDHNKSTYDENGDNEWQETGIEQFGSLVCLFFMQCQFRTWRVHTIIAALYIAILDKYTKIQTK